MRLLPHQAVAAQWLSERTRAYLADGPRTGKTYPTIVASELAGFKPEDVLVLCPASAQAVWRSAWAAFRPGQPEPRIASWEKYTYDKGKGYAAKLLILDEAHRVKAMTSKTTKLALALAKQAEAVWLLSGTPTPNHIGEIYTVLLALWPEELQTLGVRDYEGFLNRVAHWTLGEYGPRVFGLKDEEAVKGIFSRIMLRRIEVQPPPIVDFPLDVVETGEMLKASAEVEGMDIEAALAEAGGSMSKVRRLYGVAKAPAVVRLVKEEGHQGRVIMAYHLDVLAAIKAGLEKVDIRVAYVDGSTHPIQREQQRLGFMTGLFDVYLGQISANKEGIDLSRANLLDIVEPEWTPGRNEQASMRILNIGKDNRDVQVRFLYARGTIDEVVNNVLTRKQKGITQSGL